MKPYNAAPVGAEEHHGTSSGGREPSQKIDLARCSKLNKGIHTDNTAGKEDTPALMNAARTDANVFGRDSNALRIVLCPITATSGAPFERVNEANIKKGNVANGPTRSCTHRAPNAMAANNDSV